MKQIHKYIAIIILLIIVFFFGWCSRNPEPIQTDTKQLVKKAQKKEAKINKEVTQAIVIHDTIVKIRHHYHEVRRDSLIPCETKLVICDTLIMRDSILDARKDTIITDLRGLVGTWKEVHSSDSITIVGLKKEVKRQKIQKWLAIGSAFLIGAAEMERAR